MPNPQDGLSQQQGFHLIFEQTAARNLLAYGTRALRLSAFHDTTADPMMTMLSIGAEKFLKMALGLDHVSTHRAWPDRNTMQNTYRHNLVSMDQALRMSIRSNLSRATHSSYVEAALDSVDSDPVWAPLLATLNRYGAMGRFYNLDALADSPQAEEPPSAYWDLVERAAIDSEVELPALFHRAAEDNEEWRGFVAALNSRIADSLESWWAAIVMAAKQGVLGERGVLWGFDVGIDMVGTQVR